MTVDVANVLREAKAYVEYRANGATKLALVLDIDETSLSNWPNLLASDFGFFVNGTCTLVPQEPCGFDHWIADHTAEAIRPTLDLFNAAKAKGVAIFFISNRREDQRSATARVAPADRPTRLRELTGFGANPGNLCMFAYAPEHMPPKRPLVIALHGCTQTADEYDHGTGWSSLADSLGFAVVYPQQQPANNPKNCFSWFLPGDIARGHGEALSIRDGRARHCNICCRPPQSIRHRPLGRRRRGFCYARSISGGFCRGRHYRGSTLWVRQQRSTSIRGHVQWNYEVVTLLINMAAGNVSKTRINTGQRGVASRTWRGLPCIIPRPTTSHSSRSRTAH
jgi:hypothetical protein